MDHDFFVTSTTHPVSDSSAGTHSIMKLSFLALALAAPSALADYEWGAVFDVTGLNTVQWIAQKV